MINGYMKKYPDRWDFGKDDTGDITHIRNLEYYRDKYTNIDLVTSDCGIPWTPQSQEENQLLKLHFAEFVMILSILRPGGRFVAKFFFPIYYQLQIDLLFLLYNSSDELIFYKPRLNVFSKEFYVIGINLHEIKESVMEKLLSIYQSEPFDISSRLWQHIDDSFMNQLAVINNKMVQDYVFNFKKQVYYVDNHDYFDDSFQEFLKYHYRQKNVQWCLMNKLDKINEADIL